MTSVPHSGAKSVTPGGSVAGGHTKGPWEAKRYPEGDCWHIHFGDKGGWLGEVYIDGDENGAASDARLIAAAPELLEALRGLLGNAELARFHLQGTEEGMLVGSALFDTIQQARAAISKATAGETRNAEPIRLRDGDEG